MGVPFCIACFKPGNETKKGPFQAERGIVAVEGKKKS
jgi:hypothetical protein